MDAEQRAKMGDTERRMREQFGDFNVDVDMMRDVYMTDSQRAAYNRILTRALTQAQPGWRVVPVEATPEMEAADLALDIDATPAESWAAMLAAAPAPQQGEGES